MPSEKKAKTRDYAVATVLTDVGKDKTWGLVINKVKAVSEEEAIGMAMKKWFKEFPKNGYASIPATVEI